jgi:hypothetical protein
MDDPDDASVGSNVIAVEPEPAIVMAELPPSWLGSSYAGLIMHATAHAHAHAGPSTMPPGLTTAKDTLRDGLVRHRLAIR